MLVQALLRQRACTKSFLLAASSPRSPHRLYSSQRTIDDHTPDVSSPDGPSHTDTEQTATAILTTVDNVDGDKQRTSRRRSKAPAKKSKSQAEDQKPPRKPKDPSRVETFLSSIAASVQEPTIADLERHRPRTRPRIETEQYTEAYNALLETLCRSFTKDQLHRCLVQYGVRVKGARSATKSYFAKAVVEGQWGWPNLEKVEKDIRDRTEVTRQRIEISPSELFVVLGRDGETLHGLSSKHKVEVSVKRGPLSLEVKGVRISVQRFSESLKALQKSVVEETFQLPTGTPIPPQLRQRISRLADAYLENVGDAGLIRICAKDHAGLTRAKRFTTRTMSQITNVIQTPVVSHLTERDLTAESSAVRQTARKYTLYPFVSPYALPWHTNVAAFFRVKRVQDWIFPPAVFAEKEAGLDKGLKTVIATSGVETRLRDIILSRSSSADGHNVTVKARLGHVLFGTKPSSEVQPYLGPLRGTHSYDSVREWMETYDAPTFVPSLPVSLVDSSLSAQKIVHRLVFRLLNSGNFPPVLQADSSSTFSYPNELITLEIILSQPNQSLPLLREDGSDLTPLPVQARYTKSVESYLDVMLPDRAMDIRFVISHSNNDLPESEQPPVLQEYASKLHAYATDISSSATEPEPPLTWTADGKTYILHGCFAVRQHIEPSESDPPANNVISENILDLDSRQRSMHCEVLCPNPSSDAAWSGLMKGCEKLALSFYAPSASSLALANGGEPLEF
ncbi:hypothetical protein BDY19DRAFT_988764 [Irpex rosettiformis]|uniref:Uncharacterized protein n=1 Tax=Irpex rosettiformis TaxID=378272 RepID=A0ACB8UKP2_9APHY|nr:hypothetical protein BDY19DRAFT_988764 [Irpex rosettiformis]